MQDQALQTKLESFWFTLSRSEKELEFPSCAVDVPLCRRSVYYPFSCLWTEYKTRVFIFVSLLHTIHSWRYRISILMYVLLLSMQDAMRNSRIKQWSKHLSQWSEMLLWQRFLHSSWVVWPGLYARGSCLLWRTNINGIQVSTAILLLIV